MAPSKKKAKKKYFTLAEANASLPLVRAIAQDIARLAPELRDRHERLEKLAPAEGGRLSSAAREEVEHVQEQLERDHERMNEFFAELNKLGIELKDPFTGLLDFPALREGREVYLCWRLGEPEVGFWHELNAGFAGRQEISKQLA
ncbi:MAG: DUF2203 domain-containing protein [Planctomycetia bacterium]|nr:DUF2203 domain-containing protein [Planctomycetia bacterium]